MVHVNLGAEIPIGVDRRLNNVVAADRGWAASVMPGEINRLRGIGLMTDDGVFTDRQAGRLDDGDRV